MNRADLQAAFAGKRVFVTGHTGFKGAWLCLLLQDLGAEVHGFALPPENNTIFEQVGLAPEASTIGDIRDRRAIESAIAAFAPEIVFHLAAQAIVRESYVTPVETFETNVQGTVHVLEGIRQHAKGCVGVFVTTDKVYRNDESGRRFAEDDELGGRDPYSASKAASEFAVRSYRESFFEGGGDAVSCVATARAGNVIGGGDWAKDRIVPDIVRALRADRPVDVRNPHAVRPWQHVLESVSGYLTLAAWLQRERPADPGAWNFGPDDESTDTVDVLVRHALTAWGAGDTKDASDPAAPHEAGLLQLDNTHAKQVLGWQPTWDLASAVDQTMSWYRVEADCPTELAAYSREQARAYLDAMDASA